MRNKLTRRKNSGVRELKSSKFAPPTSVSDNETASKKGSPPQSDDTEYERHCMATCAAHRQVITDVDQPQTEVESYTNKLQSTRVSPKRCLEESPVVVTSARSSLSESGSGRHNCLEEIKKSNPKFPARRVFRFLKKKSSEGKCHLLSPGEKRKHPNEATGPGTHSNRLREAVFAERSPGGPSASPARSRLSRTQRLKRLRRGGIAGDPPHPAQNNTQSEKESISYSPHAAAIDDVLWTEKYSPQHSSEVIGNAGSVNKVHSWLKRWRQRMDGCDPKEEVEGIPPQNDDGSWDRGDFQGEAGSEGRKVDPLPITMLITGPPGVGKTASVYACAMELGFKVFEVNCSSQRSGRCVLAQLKEVTQSHLVEAPGREALRPAYFNNYHPRSSSSKPAALAGRNASKTTTSASKRKPVLRRRGRAPDPGAAALARFLKSTAEEPAAGASQTPGNHGEFYDLAPRPEGGGRREKQAAAMSLILFEEVDVIFQDDVGFLSAVRTLMTTTKRPVVLTTSDPSFKERFESDVEEILFKTPSAADLCSYLRLVCMAEGAWTGQHEVEGLLEEFKGDLRRCLIQLHFLVKGRARRRPQRTRPPGQSVLGPENGEESEKCVPPLADSAGCTSSVSCLNMLTKHKILHLLKCHSWAGPDSGLLTVLTESWRRHFPLLYSNLELLLPLPASTQATINCCPAEGPNTGMQTEQSPPSSEPLVQQPRESVDLCLTSTIGTCVRNSSRLRRKKDLLTVTDRRRSSPHHTLKPQQTEGKPSLDLGSHSGAHSSLDRTQDKGIKPLTPHHGLEALTCLVDLMSYLDATVATAEPHVSGLLVSKDFCWTGAEVKDGLLDEMREEAGAGGERTWRQQERLLEIQAAVEGLGFQVYRGRLSAAGSGAPTHNQELGGMGREEPMDRLALPGARDRLSSLCHLLPQPSMAQRRFELSRAVLQNRGLSLLGSRRAVCLDYMSTLRSICQHQHRLQEHDRCKNYLRSIHLGLSKSTMQRLAEECMK